MGLDHGHLAHFGPVKQFELAFVVFDKCRTAFDPVAIVAIKHIADHALFRMVNVPANHTVHVGFRSLVGDGGFEVADELDRVFHPVLEISRKRPVAVPQTPANAVVIAVEHDGEVVGRVPEIGQPLGIFDNTVKFVA